jgi:ABC-type antimicrobial peptide transport system permease subunit
VAATSLEKMRQIAEVDLAEGELPGEGEVLAPISMRSSIKVGDGIIFVFKNSDLILDSLRLRVSGFFLPTSDSTNLIYASQSQFDQLDEKRVCDRYYVYLSGRSGKAAFLSADECKKDYQSFANFLTTMSSNYGHIQSGYYSARQRYDQSKTLIEFFELIILIFLVALVIVAVATIINVLFTTVVDRIRIVGTFMAYGMTRGRAILLLSSEMLVFSFVACTLGLLAALILVDPVSRLKFTADNWTIAVILGGKRSLTVVPALWAVGATYLVGMAIPFAAATASVAKMIRGEVVSLLHFAK